MNKLFSILLTHLIECGLGFLSAIIILLIISGSYQPVEFVYQGF